MYTRIKKKDKSKKKNKMKATFHQIFNNKIAVETFADLEQIKSEN